jgi:ATP-binding cassette subfamily F protein 3
LVLSDRGEARAERRADDATSDPRTDRAAVRRAAAERRAETAPLRRRMARAEGEVTRLTREIVRLDGELSDGSLFARDPAKAAALAKSRADAAVELALAEEEWLAAGAAVEAATN